MANGIATGGSRGSVPERAPRWEAERVARALPPLLLAALKVAETVTPGVHGRRRAGHGDSFWQYRHYEPGEPARHIDWRRSARSDRPFVRENENESAQSLWLWRDGSASMDWHSSSSLPRKSDRALLLLLALASLLLRSGEQVTLFGSGLPPIRGARALDRLWLASTRQDPRAGTGLPPDDPLPRHAQAVLFGDFLVPLDRLAARLQGFAARSVRGHLVQVLDPAEESFPLTGRIRFEGLEGERELLARRSERLREGYLERLAEHRAGIAALARRFGWTFAGHRTDRSPQTALLALHAALMLPEAG